MRITKYLHSCILFETEEKVFLIDPGVFTYTQQALPLAGLSKLDYIVVTHEHQDHMHVPFILELVKKFPNVQIISNTSVVSILAKEEIHAITTESADVSFADAPHEKLWEGEVPQNIVVTIAHNLTHPGDSLQFDTTANILCLPITAPWGSTTHAVQKAIALNPKFVVPIHDWMWKDEVTKMMYGRLKEFFASKDIQFLSLETGISVTI